MTRRQVLVAAMTLIVPWPRTQWRRPVMTPVGDLFLGSFQDGRMVIVQVVRA